MQISIFAVKLKFLECSEMGGYTHTQLQSRQHSFFSLAEAETISLLEGASLTTFIAAKESAQTSKMDNHFFVYRSFMQYSANVALYRTKYLLRPCLLGGGSALATPEAAGSRFVLVAHAAQNYDN